MPKIHQTSIISPDAKIADSVEIGAYCCVGPEVTIGAGTILHHHVVVQALTEIGEGNVVYPFSVIGADPQDRKWKGERSHCIVGHGNQIREHVTIHRGTVGGGSVTRVGDDNLVMVAAHLAHDCIVGSNIVIANQVMIAGHARIEDGANIGGGAGIHHFATVGSCSFIGGLARITKDVPPFMTVEGNPAEVRAVNSLAMTRRGYSPDEINAMKDAFRRLFRENGATMTEKLAELRQVYPGMVSIGMLCDALAATANGVNGRALERMRTDDKRAAHPPTGS